MTYKVRKEVESVSKYVAGKPINEVKRELGIDKVVKLASNESPFGCSPKAKKALMDAIENSAIYPDASSYELKNVIANELGVSMDNICCGAGSDSLIKVITNTFLNEGDESVMGELTFPRYETTTKLMGAIAVTIPMKDNALDIEAMVNAITPRTKIIWFCNPNNPTGTVFTKSEFEKVLGRIPEDVIIVMDEAYIEYAQSNELPDSIELLKTHKNMIILRTFSKVYGLASVRCGYGIADADMIQYLNRVINAFDVNLYAQVAAKEAFQDKEFLQSVIEENKRGKEYLYSAFEEMGLQYVKSYTNFILVNIDRDDRPVYDALMREGYIIRPGFLLGIPRWLRITVGNMEDNKGLVEAMKKVLNK